MPFGLSSAGDIFQRKLDSIFGKLPNIVVIADDIMAYREKADHSDHDIAFTNLLETAHKNCVMLNYEKIQYKKTKVEFFGETYTTDGRKADPKKIKAIVKMPNPTSKKEVQTFLGMVQYLSKFSPTLSELFEPLRDLVHIHVPFIWQPEHTQAVEAIRNEIAQAPVLKYYDPKKPTILQTDASIKGLGAVLLQDGHPVYFASKALTQAERGYVAIELETLLASWSMEKFHHFLYGSHFTLETDQKPLEVILSKLLNSATPRLQRLLIKTFAYNFTVRYIKGEINQLADCLSHLGCMKDRISLPKLKINFTESHFHAKQDTMQQIHMETRLDDELASLMHAIVNTWPEIIKELAPALKSYWTFKEFPVENGMVLKDTCIFIPQKMRKRILNQLHEGHLGENKCQAKATQTVYWPNISEDIVQFVLNCPTCLKYSNQKHKNTKNPLGQEVPIIPWTKLGSDLFLLNGNNYLLFVDYTSRFPIVKKLKSQTRRAVADMYHSIMSEYGWPDTIVSDNGPCFVSQELKDLLKSKSVVHITSSPHYQQANGLAEKYVQVVKNLLKKATEEGKSPFNALHINRNTPLAKNKLSPMQILSGRCPQNDLPM